MTKPDKNLVQTQTLDERLTVYRNRAVEGRLVAGLHSALGLFIETVGVAMDTGDHGRPVGLIFNGAGALLVGGAVYFGLSSVEASQSAAAIEGTIASRRPQPGTAPQQPPEPGPVPPARSPFIN